MNPPGNLPIPSKWKIEDSRETPARHKIYNKWMIGKNLTPEEITLIEKEHKEHPDCVIRESCRGFLAAIRGNIVAEPHAKRLVTQRTANMLQAKIQKAS